MDLTAHPPRPGTEELGGWSWLPRMIDKARATYHGNPGSFSHPCPRDLRLLRELGLTTEEFKEIIDAAPTDEEVLVLIEEHRQGSA